MSATSLAALFRRYGVATITSERLAKAAARREDEAHPIRALFKRR